MVKLKALHDCVLFKFQDELETFAGVKQFKEKTSWGFDLRNQFDNNLKVPRWVNVIAVGPEVTEVKVGMRVLVEPLKWTSAIEVSDKESFWMTKEENILCVDDTVQPEE